MSRLVDELKREHVEMGKMLARVKEPGIRSDEVHGILLAAHRSLLAHLKKEDTQLYPALRRAAESNPRLKTLVDFYMKDMDRISKDATSFFQKYASANAALDLVFARDVGRLFATVSLRMHNEEMTLYNEYDKLNP